MSRRLPTSPLAGILVLVFLAGGLLTCFSTPADAFGEAVYDSNTVINGSSHFNVYSSQSVAQSFLAVGSYRLLNLTLRLRNVGNVDDPIDISIRTDGASGPSDTVLASTQVTIGTNAIGNYAVAFPSPPGLTVGQRYWIVASCASSILNAYEWHHSGGNTYVYGQAMTGFGSSWSNPLTPTDMYFVNYGREIEANLTAGISPGQSEANPGDSIRFRVYLNNSGDTAASAAWLNDTQVPGLTYVSDTASSAGATTAWPSFAFAGVGNGARGFDLVVRVNVGTEPGTTLTEALALTFVDGTGAVRTAPLAQAAVDVGMEQKQLYLDPQPVAGSERLDPARPTGGLGSQRNETIPRGASSNFDLDPVLARPFQTTRADATLFLDSSSHDVQDLVMNLTIADWNGVTLTPVAYVQRLVTTNAFADYEPFGFAFPGFDHTFPAGTRIRLTVTNRAASGSNAILAMNSTFAASRIDVVTSTYVRVDVLDLRDAAGPATIWSPKDALVIHANVSDPFGSGEISGAWINVTSPPSGSLIVNHTAMALLATDPSTPSVWKVFRFSLPAPLLLGTYGLLVTATEANGLVDLAEGTSVVRAPSFTLEKITTDANVRGGDLFTYDVWYNNSGTGSAGRVWINDSLPGEVTFLSSSDAGAMTGNYNWTWATRPVGNYLLRINVQVRSGLPPIPYFRNAVYLTFADEKGFVWPTETATVDVALSGPVIGVTKTSSKSFIHANETIVYQITMQNTGDAANVLWLNDSLPVGILYVSDTVTSIPTATRNVSGNLVYFGFANMPGLTTWSFTLTARAAPNLVRGSSLTNTVDLTYTNSNGFLMPPKVAGWTASVSAPDIGSASVVITRNQATPADVVTAMVTFANTGTESARDVWVNLTLDWGFLYLNATYVPVFTGGNHLHFMLATLPVETRSIFLNLSVRSNVTDHQVLSVDGMLTYSDGYRNVVGTIPIGMDGVEASVPRIVLAVTPTETTVEAGTRVFLNIYQANAGSGVAGDVWLSLQLPPHFSDAKDASNASGATRTVVGLAYTWHWSNVPPGPRSFPLELTAKPSVVHGTRANLTFHTDYTDANGAFRNGETASAFVNFLAPRINMLVDPTAKDARAGDTITLKVSLRNIGGSAARNIWVTYENESHFDIVDFSPRPGTAKTETGLNWSFTDVQPEQMRNLTLALRIRDGSPARLELYPTFVAVFTNSADIVIGNEEVKATVTIVADPTPLIWIGLGASGFGVLAAMGLVRRYKTQIEEVFLVYRDGVLLYHLSRSLSADKDEDVLSGMLTAVTEFVRDAFVYGEHRELHQLDFGDYRIMIERGRVLYLAVVYSGKGVSAIRKRVRNVLDRIETAYAGVLDKWDGDMDKVVGARDMIREYLIKAGGRRSLRGLPGLS